MPALNLHHLRLFRAVAIEGTLTGAAASMNLSASALSSQIRVLEAMLGHDLFERRGRGLVLTEAGRIALEHAEAIFRTADDLAATLRERRQARRLIRIGALATLSRNFQLQFLRPVLARPDVEIVLRSGSLEELLHGLETMTLDIVLTNAAPLRDAARPWLIRRLSEQPVSLIGAPRRVGGSGRSLARLLADEPLVLPGPHTAIRAGFDALLERLQLRPAIAAEADDMAMLRLLAREDIGLAVLPPIVVQDELASGRLTIAAELEGLNETFMAVTLPRRVSNPLLAELVADPF
jgi:LysR family transcriptional activator of nhaA